MRITVNGNDNNVPLFFIKSKNIYILLHYIILTHIARINRKLLNKLLMYVHRRLN